MAQVFLNHRVTMELLQKPIPQGHFSPSPSGEEHPLKVPKLEKSSSKAALKKENKNNFKNQQPLTKYIIGGKEAWETVSRVRI